MDFRILGTLEVLDGERMLDVGGGKQRAVLALLLLRANEAVPSERLIDELWPNEPPPSAAKIIQAHVSRLRKALDGTGDGRILLTRTHGYVLSVQPGELDRDRFRGLLEEGRKALAADDFDEARGKLRSALALWRGPPLADFAYESFAQEEIARLEELHLAALEERIEADMALGRHDAVLPELEHLVRRHPLRERLRGQLMLALYRAGRQVEALEAYRDARRTLADELGLEPSPTLQQLERGILGHAPELQAAKPRRVGRTRRIRTVQLAGVLGLVAAAIAAGAFAFDGNNRPSRLSSIAADSVGVIDPATNTIVDQVPVGATPTRIAFGDHGVWVISQHDKTVTRIDPETRKSFRTIAVGGPAVDVAVGRTAVWLLLSADTATAPNPTRIARIDPRLNDLVLPTIPLGIAPPAFTSNGGGGSIAAASQSVWVVNPDPQVAVSRIDAMTNTVKATFGVGEPTIGFDTGSAGGVPGSSGIVLAFGDLWVGGNTGVVRINTRSRTISSTIRLSVGAPTAIAAGEGSVWVAARPGFRCCPPKTVGIGTLTRIDPTTNSVEDIIPLGGQPAAVAVGGGGIWIADPDTHSVLRIDPSTNDIVARIPIGARPRGITVGAGLVWVSAS